MGGGRFGSFAPHDACSSFGDRAGQDRIHALGPGKAAEAAGHPIEFDPITATAERDMIGVLWAK